MIKTFAELIHPITPEVFFAEYFDKQPLHIPGSPEKVADLLSWRKLNDLLEMTSIWTSDSVELVLDQKPIPPAAFCVEGRTRDLRRALKPDRRKVMSFLEKGATLALDFVERLSPEMIAVTEAVEEATGGAITGSIFCSWEGRQGFASHHDTLDVFAIQCEGQKLWKLWEGRYPSPVDVDGYNSGSFSVDHHLKNRGALRQELVMRPGDVLYVPIGLYHDALALPGESLHLSLGVNRMYGQQFFDALIKESLQDEAFRRPMPDFRDREAVALRIHELAERLKRAATEPAAVDFFIGVMRQHCFGTRAGYTLPDRTGADLFLVSAEGVKIVRRGSEFQIRIGETVVVLSPTQKLAAEWVLNARRFTTADYDAALADVPRDDRIHVLSVLRRCKVVQEAA